MAVYRTNVFGLVGVISPQVGQFTRSDGMANSIARTLPTLTPEIAKNKRKLIDSLSGD
jgi:hypothetical protein